MARAIHGPGLFSAPAPSCGPGPKNRAAGRTRTPFSALRHRAAAPMTRLLLPLATIGLSFLQCASPPPSLPQAPDPGSASPHRHGISLSPSDARRIGMKIWHNEAGGTTAGLTHWNRGEHFASLGIGHFIWYPAGVRQTYEESFPRLLQFLQWRGVGLPAGLTPGTACPWSNRSAFLAAARSPRMQEIRHLLSRTISLQTEFIIRRTQAALPSMLRTAPPTHRHRIARHFRALTQTPNGLYALIDYVNFKGEGVNPAERYRGRGWGLLQVLHGMEGRPTGQAATREFANSAKRTLERRIANAPKEESQWRAGWFRRCETYAQPW